MGLLLRSWHGSASLLRRHLAGHSQHIRHPRVTGPKIPPDHAAEAVRRAGGVLAVAARALGIHRSTLHEYVNRYPEVAAAYDDATETTLDVCEHGLAQFAQGHVQGQTTRERLDAIKYTLRTKGRARGYGDRLDTTGHIGVHGAACGLSLDDFLPPAS